MRAELTGIGASRGMALGRARVVQVAHFEVDQRPLAEDEVGAEVVRLGHAMESARNELTRLRERVMSGSMAREIGEFIDAHQLMLADPELLDGLDDLIRTGRYRASAALKIQRDRLVAVFDAIDDPYLRSRRDDVEQVIGRVFAALTRDASLTEQKMAARMGDILVTDTVAPAELAHLPEQGLLGVVSSGGSALSHSAILARSLRLPMVTGAHEALNRIREGDLLLVDGSSGQVIVHPVAGDLAHYRRFQREAARDARALARLRTARTNTKDGTEIHLYANAEMPADITQAHQLGAAGIGLYRTEFLFLQRQELPDEEEQFVAYRDLVLGMAGRPVTIRTLDLGADKAQNTGLKLAAEPNPALGLRGIRLALGRPDLFRTQLRAMLRASAYGTLRILLPMVSGVEEILGARALMREVARDLRSAGFELADNFELGAMVEVPAAAILLPTMIRHLDFVSIGTNDLVQYTLAADRNNDAMADWYDPLHPAILRLLAQTIRVTQRAGKAVTLCGEMAGDTRYTALLLALGLTDFSMHPGTLLEVRRAVRESDWHELRSRLPALLRAGSRDAINKVLARM